MGQWHTPRHLTKVEQLLNAVVIFSFFQVVSWTMLQNAHDRSNILKPAHVYPLARLQPRPPALTVTFVLRRIRSQLHTLERAFFPHLNVQNYSTDSQRVELFFKKNERLSLSNFKCALPSFINHSPWSRFPLVGMVTHACAKKNPLHQLRRFFH